MTIIVLLVLCKGLKCLVLAFIVALGDVFWLFLYINVLRCNVFACNINKLGGYEWVVYSGIRFAMDKYMITKHSYMSVYIYENGFNIGLKLITAKKAVQWMRRGVIKNWTPGSIPRAYIS